MTSPPIEHPLTVLLQRCFTRHQVALRLGVSPARVDQLRREGAIEAVETPLGNLFTPEAVEALETERAARKEPPE